MNTRVIIDIDFNEYLFVKGAIKQKASSLLDYMDRCLDEALHKDKLKEDPKTPKKQVKKMVKKPIRKTK
jgi:hypothetical protein